MRYSREQMFIEMAHSASKRSTCFRLNVGAIGVAKNNNIVAVGYNGRRAGEPHCQGDECPGRFQCKETIHAEANAIARAVGNIHTLYVTDSPCQSCTELIMLSDVKRLVFDRPYRLTEHLEYLRNRGIQVHRITPAGYIIDWFSKAIINDVQ